MQRITIRSLRERKGVYNKLATLLLAIVARGCNLRTSRFIYVKFQVALISMQRLPFPYIRPLLVAEFEF